MNFNELPDGFYIVKQTDSPDPERNWSLVRLYYNHDAKTRGIGFGIWDGPGFVPLSDLSETTVLTPVRIEGGDKLDGMFDMQRALNKRCGVDTSAMSDEEKGRWVLQFSRALSQETAELVDSVPWKWWAKYQQFDEQNARVEVIDIFHFVISLAQVLGLSAEDVFRIYSEKNKVNHKRQDSGYAVKTDDNKAIA